MGAWVLTEVNFPEPLDLNDDGTASTNLLDEFSCFKGSLAFQANGKYTQSFGTLEEVEMDGDTMIVCGEPIATGGTYTLSGNQLTTTDSEGTVTVVTVNLQTNTLVGFLTLENFGNVTYVFVRG